MSTARELRERWRVALDHPHYTGATELVSRLREALRCLEAREVELDSLRSAAREVLDNYLLGVQGDRLRAALQPPEPAAQPAQESKDQSPPPCCRKGDGWVAP